MEISNENAKLGRKTNIKPIHLTPPEGKIRSSPGAGKIGLKERKKDEEKNEEMEEEDLESEERLKFLKDKYPEIKSENETSQPLGWKSTSEDECYFPVCSSWSGSI